MDKTLYDEVVRIVIPKACVFIYEVVNNRGGRHDAHTIDANEMDATIVIPAISWILAELVRFCGAASDTEMATDLIAGLTKRKYRHYLENTTKTFLAARWPIISGNFHGLLSKTRKHFHCYWSEI
jgi:hypothetical protein